MQKNKYPNQDNLDGIKLSTIFSGIKEPFQNKDDLLLIELDKNSSIGGIFTKSLTASAPVIHCKNNLKSSINPSIRAILVNSGNANAFTGYLGDRTVENITEFLSKKLNCETNEIYTASTGVIGEILNPEIIINGLRKMSLHIKQIGLRQQIQLEQPIRLLKWLQGNV